MSVEMIPQTRCDAVERLPQRQLHASVAGGVGIAAIFCQRDDSSFDTPRSDIGEISGVLLRTVARSVALTP
jgi:hypothetical protein